jgi:hypothetical protein
LGSTRQLGLNLEKAIKQSKFTPPSPIKAIPSESASNGNIVRYQKIVSDHDIACPATLSDQAILCNYVILSNPATSSNPAILCNFALISNPGTPCNPATFGDPSLLSNADDVMLTSPCQSEDVHVNMITTVLLLLPIQLKVEPQQQ